MGMLGLAFGILLTGIMEWRIEEDLQTSANDRLHAIASSIAHRLNEDLSNRHREVALMADLLSSKSLAPDSIGRVIEGLKVRQPVYAWIGLADNTGLVVAATGNLLEGHNVGARPWFKAALQGGFVGDPHEAKLLAPHMKPSADGEPTRFLDIAVPVQDANRQVVGVLGGHLYWEWVRNVVRGATSKLDHVGPVEVLIADQNGQWLFSTPPEVPSNLSELATVIQQGQYAMARETVQPVNNTSGLGWSVVVMEDVKYAHAAIKEGRTFMLMFAASLAITFSILTWVVAGKVVQPIVNLARAARNQAGFEGYVMDTRRGGGTDETRTLGHIMNRLTHYDTLTGLTNRKEVTERIGQTMARTLATGSHSALLLLNLDNFGVFNNVKGYEAGDQMLVAVAKRLRDLLADGTTLSRINGDEFVIVLDDLGPEASQAVAEAQAVAHKLQGSFQIPFMLEAGTFGVRASIGIYLITPKSSRVSEVMLFAELAMREAKRRGKSQTIVFTDDMQSQLAEHVRFEEDLVAAVPSQLVVLYQPQVDRTGQVEGAELLVRWRHPERGLVSPALFIPLAEDTGLIKPIGRWVMEAACRQIRQWADDPLRRKLVLSVNVSAKEFASQDYVSQVQAILDDTGANPARLKLELTESAVVTDVEDVITKMRQLKQMGLTFSLDDFGTGFSSLSYLGRMPIDQLKIDQSFVRNLTRNCYNASIVRAVISLGDNLDIGVIAEGVEKLEQKEILEELGCMHYQGYLYGRPMALSDFEDTLRNVSRQTLSEVV